VTPRATGEAAEGLLVVDKPSGLTSHDVVQRVRRLARTRKVGHAGTLDPMATGVLVLGLGRATRLLGHLSTNDKGYTATIRLGRTTVTDDAEGEVDGGSDASGVSPADVLAGVALLTGEILQRPSKVSAIKVDGQRAYKLVRAGDEVELAPRPVTVSRFDVLDVRTVPRDDGPGAFVDVDVVVECSTGTYVRALARDLGQALGVGGHLTALRRTRVGVFDEGAAVAVSDDLDVVAAMLTLDQALAMAFPSFVAPDELVPLVLHGRPVDPEVAGEAATQPVFAALGPDGRGLALMEIRDALVKPVVVFE
jgi:tRNA pseudouridine55 synthase